MFVFLFSHNLCKKSSVIGKHDISWPTNVEHVTHLDEEGGRRILMQLTRAELNSKCREYFKRFNQ